MCVLLHPSRFSLERTASPAQNFDIQTLIRIGSSFSDSTDETFIGKNLQFSIKFLMMRLTLNSSSRDVYCAVAVRFSQCMMQRQTNEGTDNKGTTSLVPKQASKLPVTHVSYMTHYVSPFYLRNNTTAPIVSYTHVCRTLLGEMYK